MQHALAQTMEPVSALHALEQTTGVVPVQHALAQTMEPVSALHALEQTTELE